LEILLLPRNFDTKKEVNKMSTDRIREIEKKLAELKERIPVHSAPPSMLLQLEELEDELEKAKQE